MHTVPVRPFLGGARFSFVGVFHIKSGQICANLSNQLCRDIGNLSVTKGISAVMSSCSADSLQVLQAAGCRRPLQISFGGCGALCVYHTGVWKCIADNASHLLEEFEQLYGASAGAFTAVCAACKCDPVVVYEWIMEIFKNSREYCIAFGVVRPSFRLYSRMREFLERVLPWDAHKLCKNRVNISLSVVEGIRRFPRNWLLTDFTTRKELINAVIASSFMPGYGGEFGIPLIRGKRCFDGGFTSNIPFLSDPNVITVTPFSGEADICPPMEPTSAKHVTYCDQPFQMSSENLSRLKTALCPTSMEILEELYHLGNSNALSFLKRRGLIWDGNVSDLEAFITKERDYEVAIDHKRIMSSKSREDSGFFSAAQESESECEEEQELKAVESKGVTTTHLGHQLLKNSCYSSIVLTDEYNNNTPTATNTESVSLFT